MALQWLPKFGLATGWAVGTKLPPFGVDLLPIFTDRVMSASVLTIHRDAIQHVHDQVVGLLNNGYFPGELPPRYRSSPHICAMSPI